ncbi:MAG: glycoside hydrolase family 2 protein [Streptosporangiaceae bacterium]
MADGDGAPEERETRPKRRISRRTLIKAGLIGGAGVAAVPLIALIGSHAPTLEEQPTNLTFPLNSNWLFGGQYSAGSESVFYNDSSFAPVALPHSVAALSWRNWNPDEWQQIWIYRRHFSGGPLVSPHPPGNRIFVDFDGVMVNAMVVINDQPVFTHQGGYLPFSAELTSQVTSGDNLLSVIVDARSLPVPPLSPGYGPYSIDFFQPGGIYRDVTLRVVPRAFLSDLFAQPTNVLTSQPGVDIEATIDSGLSSAASGTLTVDLLDGSRLISTQAVTVTFDSNTTSTAKLSLTGLGPVSLWSTTDPKLYTVRATLSVPEVGSHMLTRRIGFRELSFQPDGFYLNGERVQLFGLNRHQLFPYAGMAMPARVQRRDAEILRNELNCNMVRCSHYPQSPHFLDACDELGLLVWEEAPGWHNVSSNPAWQDLVLQNVRDMVIRDRSRPSVVIWGTRLNETPDVPGLWEQTRHIAAELDGSRPSSGAMLFHSVAEWNEDVFGYNDYSVNWKTGDATLRPPIPGVPYLITESVGVEDVKPEYFTWTGPPELLVRQAELHAQVQNLARSDPGYAGLLAWAGFDYGSFQSLDQDTVKWAGVVDSFRVPKPGAGMYQAQVDPAIRPVIVPLFFWELSGTLPVPAPTAMIASNCDLLHIFIDGVPVASVTPAAYSPLYRNLPYPPFFVRLPTHTRTKRPELLIQGWVGGQQVAELRMSSDPSGDRLAVTADDAVISADGTDATRVLFRAVDAYGNQRRYLAGEVTLNLSGPGILVGDNPFAFGEYGGLGAVWVRSLSGQPGTITVTATHLDLGQAQVQVQSQPVPQSGQLI